MSETPPPRPADLSSPPTGLGHGYCWAEHPKWGGRCIHPAGHKEQGVDHHDPYARPPLTWS